MTRWSSFLKSVTGMLTAAATLLAAIAGLVTAVTQLRGDHRNPEAAAVTTVVASIVWTDGSADMLSFAWRDDGNLNALYMSRGAT
jgi:hypothetical protein